MKRITLILVIFVFAVTSCKEDKSKKIEIHHAKKVGVKASNGDFALSSSELIWKGYKPTGSHRGTIKISSATLSVKDNKLVGGKFSVDMNSIKNLDIPESDPYNKKLVAHLKNSDFFDTKKYPEATFEITNVNIKDEISLIEGNLTLKGITKSISFPATVIFKENELVFYSNTIKIDRTDFGIKYKSKKFFGNLKDKFINDLFDISFKVVAKKVN